MEAILIVILGISGLLFGGLQYLSSYDIIFYALNIRISYWFEKSYV